MTKSMIRLNNYKTGSVFIEAAIVFPIIIAVIAMAIRISFTLYEKVKDNSIDHKENMIKNYEIYEKGRLLVSIYSDNAFIDYGLSFNHYRS